MELALPLCTMRSWRGSDVPSLVRHADNVKVWRNLRDRFPHPYTAAHGEAWVRAAAAARPETHFAIAVEDEAAGGVGLELGSDICRRTAEIGFWLGEAYWGRGIATQAVRALTGLAFSRFDLVRVQAGVLEWNPASMRALEKAGYVREARLRRAAVKDGHVLDLILYSILRDRDHPAGPAPASHA